MSVVVCVTSADSLSRFDIGTERNLRTIRFTSCCYFRVHVSILFVVFYVIPFWFSLSDFIFVCFTLVLVISVMLVYAFLFCFILCY